MVENVIKDAKDTFLYLAVTKIEVKPLNNKAVNFNSLMYTVQTQDYQAGRVGQNINSNYISSHDSKKVDNLTFEFDNKDGEPAQASM